MLHDYPPNVTSPTDQQPNPLSEALCSRIERGWSTLRRLRSVSLISAGIGLFSGLFALLWMAEASFYLPAWFKSIFLLLSVFFGLGSAVVLSRRLRDPDFTEFYADLAQKTGLIAIRHALDLYRSTGAKTLLHQAALEQNLKQYPLEEIEKQQKSYINVHKVKKVYQRSLWSNAGVGLILLLSAVFYGSGLPRTLQFWKSFQPPIPFTYTIVPGNEVYEQGSSVKIQIRFKDRMQPQQVAVGLKTEIEDDFRFESMQRIDDRTYESAPIMLSNTTAYTIKMDRFFSDIYALEVQLRPRFEQLTVTVSPPRHTQIEPYTQSYPFSVLEVYPGTRITVEGSPNKALRTVTMITTLGDSIGLKIDAKGGIRYPFTATRADTLEFRLTDQQGFTNNNPFAFVIKPMDDLSPVIELLEPKATIELLQPEPITLGYEYLDDFGFHQLLLRYEIKKPFGKPETGSIKLPTPTDKAGLSTAVFDLGQTTASSLDEITYWLEIKDNDAVAGFKTAQSQKQRIKMSTMADYMDLVEEKEQGVEDQVEQMDQQYQQFEKMLETFQEDLKKNQLNEFDQQQMLQELQDKQEQVNESARELKEQFEQLRDELQQNKLLSPETLKQYEQLQKLIEEIDSPELREALRQMQESLENMDPGALQEAMKNLEFNEELYKQRLERTLELFRQVKTTAELDKLAKQYEELARQQRENAREKDADQQREQQKSINETFEKTKDPLQGLDKEAPQKSKEDLEKLKNELKKDFDKTQEALDKVLEQMQQDSSSPSSPGKDQQEAEDQLEQMAKKVRGAMSNMSQKQNSVNATALKSILRTLVLLSDAQESVTTKASSLPNRSQGFVDLAKQENAISTTFEQTIDSLVQVASKAPELSNVVLEKKLQVQRNLDNALTYLAERDQANAAAETRYVLSGFNELATMIANILDQMQNQSNGSGQSGSGSMMEQLQEMSGQQQQLNQKLQDMINDIQGDRLRQDQMERLNQMARQQNAIRKQLEQLRKNGNFPDGDKIMSELERLNEEMEDAINDLRGGNLDRPFIQRQQNILSRMLDAEKALQERDEDDKRKGENPDERLEGLPGKVTLEELRKRIRSRLSDPNYSKYNQDYQELIEKYFEMLDRRRQ
jgi:hypothetical protein